MANIHSDINKSYLALGDSYTIGEAVEEDLSFPFQLIRRLNSMGKNFSKPRVIAKTGWTTSELQNAIKVATELEYDYDLVTLLIGVNNQYRGNSIVDYRSEFRELLFKAIELAGGNENRVFVISIPDWGATPFGKTSGRDPKAISEEIDMFNAVNKSETLAFGIKYVDITPNSRQAISNNALFANDGLHPSQKMYAEWVKLILEAFEH